MNDTTLEQSIKQLDVGKDSISIIQHTTLLLARVEKQKIKLQSDPRPLLDKVNPVELFQICMDQQGFTENRGQLWQDIAHASVPQLYALYDNIDKNQKNAYQSVIEKDVESIKLPTDQALTLARILTAYSIHDPQVGYCHGMAHWVSPILSQMDEKETFATVTRLMDLYDLRELYINGLSQCLDTFQLILVQLCPELKQHLDHLRIHPSVYAASWFFSLFTQSPLGSNHISRLYDHIFLEGAIESCLRLAVYLMQKNEKRLLQKSSRSEVLACIQSQDFFSVCDFQDMMRLNQSIVHQLSHATDIRESLSALQKENTVLKMHTMEHEAAHTKISKRNSILEKRVKKYKIKLANNAVQPLPTPPVIKEEEPDKKDNFNSFVDSLRGSGDFGALIAGAIMTDSKAPNINHNSSSDEEEEDVEETEKKQQAALQNVTSELVSVKMDHYGISQKYQTLCRQHENLNRQLQQVLESHNALTQKISYLSSELEDTTGERDQIYGEQEHVLEMAMVAKKTATELQLEKMTLTKEVERLQHCVSDLENEKKAYFMPRDTFSEEVFAAHNILFGQKKENRRHTMAVLPNPSDNEYKTKFAESELRCRELEKYLAEAKVKLADLESSLLYPPVRRTSSVHLKRSSTASMLARVSTPTTEPRASSESYASSTTSLTSINSSQYNSKRSSMYSRIWNAFGNSPVTTPTNQLKNSILCQEPQII